MKVKIKSNPYIRKIEYFVFDEESNNWVEASKNNRDSKLREEESEKCFLPFKAYDILKIIISDYYVSGEPVEITFEGASEEYNELLKISEFDDINGKVVLSQDNYILENAKTILSDTKDIFREVNPIIDNIVTDEAVRSDLRKVLCTLDDVVPICVFGNYSAGKSTFINSLIGYEILPSGGDPVTAKIYEISSSDDEDLAKIKFKHFKENLNNSIELLFEKNSFRIRKGDTSDEMLVELKELMEEVRESGFVVMVNKALEFINAYEKIDMDSIEISETIFVEVPFSKKGILGQSKNKFVIFDTPGSNSNSNTDHSQVLADALHEFSNGIPVWVSQYESVDSNDNAKLCDDVLNIKALDKRFTMIILNKADTSNLPEGGFSDKQIQDIMELNSVEKMYSGGIYFVSSLMGLGAKTDGKFNDRYFNRTYGTQKCLFTNPEDFDYCGLYLYNILPQQIKDEASIYSMNEEDKVYANSGLHFVEKEMEDFATKYSAYNKCQMVFMFLENVINKTTDTINTKTEILTKKRAETQKQLGNDTQKLLETLTKTTEQKEKEFYKSSKSFINDYTKNGLSYTLDAQELTELDNQIAMRNESESDYAKEKDDVDRAADTRYSHVVTNFKNIFKSKGVIQNFAQLGKDFISDSKDISTNKEEMLAVQNENDSATSDEIMNIVNEHYQCNITDAKCKMTEVIKEHWSDKAEEMKNTLVAIITGNDSLTAQQQGVLFDTIMNHQNIEFDEESSAVFIKAKYLKGQIFGFKLFDNERLNISRLSKKFNSTIEKNIEAMAKDLNESGFSAYKEWQDDLFAVIEQNITELNPQLKQYADQIKVDTESINKLASDKQKISESLEAIRELISWKEI